MDRFALRMLACYSGPTEDPVHLRRGTNQRATLACTAMPPTALPPTALPPTAPHRTASHCQLPLERCSRGAGRLDDSLDAEHAWGSFSMRGLELDALAAPTGAEVQITGTFHAVHTDAFGDEEAFWW